ncbi:MAG: hypothetical protein ACRDS0_09775 [Pseudonocardiaceae bacterium]
MSRDSADLHGHGSHSTIKKQAIQLWPPPLPGLADQRGFVYYQAAIGCYQDPLLPTGTPAGTPDLAPRSLPAGAVRPYWHTSTGDEWARLVPNLPYDPLCR